MMACQTWTCRVRFVQSRCFLSWHSSLDTRYIKARSVVRTNALLLSLDRTRRLFATSGGAVSFASTLRSVPCQSSHHVSCLKDRALHTIRPAVSQDQSRRPFRIRTTCCMSLPPSLYGYRSGSMGLEVVGGITCTKRPPWRTYARSQK
jgi:hypothetical protein